MVKKLDAYIEYNNTVGRAEELTLTAGGMVVPVIVLKTKEGLRYPMLSEETRGQERTDVS